MDKQESLKYVRSHCCGVVLEGQFHLLGGATKVPGERSDNVASDMHQVSHDSSRDSSRDIL